MRIYLAIPLSLSPLSWQSRKRNSSEKAALILPELARLRCGNVVDIGCNAGEVSRLVSPGRFVVGLDAVVDTTGFKNPLQGVALGQNRVSVSLVELMPRFDAILLLSVHHQWYAGMEHSQADELFKVILSSPIKAVLVEFAAINAKYGSDQGFLDNDEESVKSYASIFLKQCISLGDQVKFLGKSSELPGKEPYRFMFLIEKPTT